MEIKRIDEFDIAKGIGILLVVLGHTTGISKNEVLEIFIYSFHMPLFFILSGLVFRREGTCSLKENILKEKKLIVNYSFFSLLYIFFDVIVQFITLHSIQAVNLINTAVEAIFLYGISVLWFISSLTIGKILLRLLVGRIESKKVLLLIAIILFCLGILVAKMIPSENIHGILKLIYYPVVAFVRSIIMSTFLIIGYIATEDVKKLIENSTLFVGGV